VSPLEHIVIPAAEESQPDLLPISAGYDAHRDDERHGCELEAPWFADMAQHVRALGVVTSRAACPVGHYWRL
jgi:acetoin utilization deacetylase AcuC-like enzyme